MSEKKIEAVNGHTLQKVFLSVEDHIAVMTLHNPPVNAADGVVQEEILLLCDYINHEDDIWVCIMHSDIKTFCVGVDIKRFYQSILDKDRCPLRWYWARWRCSCCWSRTCPARC